MNLQNFENIVAGLAAGITSIAAVVALIMGFRSGALKRLKIGSSEIEASRKDIEEVKALIASASSPPSPDVPFETEHLARYYAQVLMQSKVAFWFSLIFASFGFFVIIAAALMYSDGNTTATIIQGVAGVVVDAVAALFFVQSKRAQSAMSEFFEKLRKDRQQLEARKFCEEVSDPASRDALRIQLSMYYAGLENHDEAATMIIQKRFGSKDKEDRKGQQSAPADR